MILHLLSSFPFELSVNTDYIDTVVRNFSIKYDLFFSSIRSFLNSFVNIIYSILSHMPWFMLILIVFILGWRLNNKISKGFLYAFLLSLIGIIGLWDLMNETLSIVIASVIISLVLGFPLGILISSSDKADTIIRPILDTMQTMPVFVYLIPALLFFGLGKPPAVIATTIYAIVPMIRLTNHGIRQIDKGNRSLHSFCSTKLQSLIKVKYHKHYLL